MLPACLPACLLAWCCSNIFYGARTTAAAAVVLMLLIVPPSLRCLIGVVYRRIFAQLMLNSMQSYELCASAVGSPCLWRWRRLLRANGHLW